MDDHGQIGPEKGDYAADASKVALALRARPTYVELAHRGTKLRLVLAWKPTLLFFDAQPDGQGDDFNDWIFVSVVEHGTYWFNVWAYHDPGYVSGKLDVENADGATIGEFLTRIASAWKVKEVA